MGLVWVKIDGSGSMKRWDTWLDLVGLAGLLGDCDGSTLTLKPFSLPRLCSLFLAEYALECGFGSLGLVLTWPCEGW